MAILLKNETVQRQRRTVGVLHLIWGGRQSDFAITFHASNRGGRYMPDVTITEAIPCREIDDGGPFAGLVLGRDNPPWLGPRSWQSWTRPFIRLPEHGYASRLIIWLQCRSTLFGRRKVHLGFVHSVMAAMMQIPKMPSSSSPSSLQGGRSLSTTSIIFSTIMDRFLWFLHPLYGYKLRLFR